MCAAITLELLGGYTEMDRDAPNPRVELLVVAGRSGGVRACSAAVAVGRHAGRCPTGTVVDQLAFQLALSNIIVAVVQHAARPAAGRRPGAARRGLWRLTGTGTGPPRSPAGSGRAVAVGTAGAGRAAHRRRILAPLALPLMLLVAFTLWRGAGQSIRHGPDQPPGAVGRPGAGWPGRSSRYPPARRWPRRSAGAPARARPAPPPWRGRRAPAGWSPWSTRRRRTPYRAERRPWLAVDAVARPLAALPTLPLGLDGERLMAAVQAHPGAQYVVTAGEDVVGVLHIADLAQLLEPTRKMNT